MRTKFWFLNLALTLSLSVQAATFTFTDASAVSQEVDGVLLELGKGKNTQAPAYSDYSAEMRLYVQNTITIVAEEITSVQLVFSSNADNGKTYASLSSSPAGLVSGGVSTGNKDWKIDTWSGKAEMVVFTIGNESKGQRIIKQVVVNGEPIVLDPEEQEVYIDNTPLEEDFAYSEPTAVITPDKNFFKKEYAFIESNIRVSCSQGSILNNDTAIYFNCNAGHTLTLEASKPIKGLVINGAVRKLFTATADKGDITYLSPDASYTEDYQECEHALILKDVNAKTVSISCEKQIRCYSIYVYFDENPEATIDCDSQSGEGETFFLTYDAADLVYESELSQEEGVPNYTLFLYEEGTDYPFIALDLYPAAQDNLAGTYDMEDGSLGEYSWYQYGEDGNVDFTWAKEGALAITVEGETYTVSGYITCEDNNTYNFTYTGKPLPYTDTEYYDTPEGIEGIYPPLDTAAPMYDILGRKVNKGYRGVVIQNGNKYLLY